jgi:hypothetical protein
MDEAEQKAISDIEQRGCGRRPVMGCQPRFSVIEVQRYSGK